MARDRRTVYEWEIQRRKAKTFFGWIILGGLTALGAFIVFYGILTTGYMGI